MEHDENEDNKSQPRPFPEGMAVDPESHTIGHQVREYLWGKGPVDYPVVSAQMKRELVSKFVRFELPDLPPANYWRVRILFDLYNLQEHLGFVSEFLKRNEESAEELGRSIATATILGEVGDDAQKQQARDYYEYSVKHQFANENFEDLIRMLGSMAPEISAESLDRRMRAEVSELAQRESRDPEAGVVRRDLEDLIENEFFFIGEAAKARSRIDSVDPDRRLYEILKSYVEATDDGGAEYLDLWLQQQIRRYAEKNGRPALVEEVRKLITQLPSLSVPDSEFAKIRLLNAIEYFETELSPEEAEFMAENSKKQVDPLRFAPIPVQYEPEEPAIPEEDDDE